MKNTGLYHYKESLLPNISALLNFIRNTPSLNNFWGNNLEKAILKAALSEVEFTSSGPNGASLTIRFKDKAIFEEAVFNKKTLGQFNLTNTDPENGITAKLNALKKDSPNNIVKKSLKIIIEENNRKTNIIKINEIIDYLKRETDKKGLENESAVFFDAIKKLMLLEAKVPSSLTPETLFSLVCLKPCVIKALNTLLHSLTKELKGSQVFDFDIPKALLAYTALFDKVKKAFAEKPQTKVIDLIDKLIQSETDNEDRLKNYFYFKDAYYEKKGFQFFFGNNFIYSSTQGYHQQFNSFKGKYLALIQIIETLSTYIAPSPSLQEATDQLVNQLKKLTDNYFYTLLSSSLDKNVSVRAEQQAFEKFKSKTENAIKKYEKNNILEVKTMSILYKLLNAIAKLIPGFILSTQTRTNFFKKTPPHRQQLYLFQRTVQAITLSS